MTPVSVNIRKYRKLKGLTQQQLADAAGLSVMSIRRYETGARDPSENVVKSIAEALRVHPADIDDRLAIFLGSDLLVQTEDGEFIAVSMDTREGKLLSSFQALNREGKDEVIRYSDMLLDINKYRRVPFANNDNNE